MAGAIKTTMGIPPKDIEINLDALDKIVKHLEISDVFNLRKASKSVNKIIIEAVPAFQLEALSLKQTIARHKLYKDEHFNKFLDQAFLEENKISGNIYGSKNQKKIILKLLEKIKTITDNDDEKTKFQDWLSTYLEEYESVDLSNTEITNESLKELVELYPQIESLNLSGCKKITNDGIQSLGRLKKLRLLDLSFCKQITDLSSLAECTNLQSLSIWCCSSQVTHRNASELITKLPNLKITS